MGLVKALRTYTIVEKDGEINLTGLPCKKGQRVETIILFQTPQGAKISLTAQRLLDSGLIGLWKDRTDIGDSTAYARRLREQAQRRDRG